jgi:hypothetical protein
MKLYGMDSNLLLKEYIKTSILNEIQNNSFFGSKINNILHYINKIYNEVYSENENAEDVYAVLYNYLTKELGYSDTYGSFRHVYELDQDFIIKIARNYTGTENNKSEKQNQILLGNFSPKIYTSHKDYFYIVVEKCSIIGNYNGYSMAAINWVKNALNNDYIFYYHIEPILSDYRSRVSDDYIKSFVKYILTIAGLIKSYDAFNVYKKDKINKEILLLPICGLITKFYNSGNKGGVLDIRTPNVGYGTDQRCVILDIGDFSD